MVADSCPNHDRLRAFVGGALEDQEASSVAAHLDGCQTCEQIVSELELDPSLVGRGFQLLPGPDHDVKPGFDDESQLSDAVRELCDSASPSPSTSPSSSTVDDSAADSAADTRSGRSRHTGVQGKQFGDFQLIEEIARGGMGVVYAARQISLNRTVALKMILAGQLATADDIARFRSEAEAAALLDHPGIVPVFEVGEADGRHFFSMGLVQGMSLSRRLESGPLPPREAAQLLLSIAQAIQYAHEKGVVHRDLKPSNILLDGDGTPRVTDFGLAKRVESDSGLTMTTQIMGTPSYMSPEQAMGKSRDAGPATDVYSLGAILYALLTGRPPFQAASPAETVRQVADETPVSPRQLNRTTPRDLETICLKCLEKHPLHRYETAATLADDLGRFLARRPIRAQPISLPEQAWRWCVRQPVIAGLLATVFAVLVAGIAVSMFFAHQASGRADQMKKMGEDDQVARLAAEGLARSFNAQRLAAQARGVMEQSPRLALLLAVEAVESTLRENEPVVPDAEASLREALEIVGGEALSQHESGVNALALAADDQSLLSISNRGLHHHEFSGQAATVRAVPTSGRGLAVTKRGVFTTGRNAILRWDPDDWSESARSVMNEGTLPQELAVSPDQRWLVGVTSKEQIGIWDLRLEDIGARPHRVVTLKGGGSRTLAIANDWFAVGGSPAACFALQQDIAEPFVLEMNGFGPVAASPAGDWIASADNETVHLWDMQGGWPPRGPITLGQHGGDVTEFAVSADGHRLASAAAGRTIRLWNTEDPGKATPLQVLQSAEEVVYALALSDDARYLAAGGNGKVIRIWDLSRQSPGYPPRVIRGYEQAVTRLLFSRDSRWLYSAGTEGLVRRTSVPLGRLQRHELIPPRISANGDWAVEKVSPPGQPAWLAQFGYLDAPTRLVRLTPRELSGTWELPSDWSRIGFERFAGRWLLVGSPAVGGDDARQGGLRACDLHAPDPTRAFVVLDGIDDVQKLERSDDGTRVIAIDSAGKLCSWKLQADTWVADVTLPDLQIAPNAATFTKDLRSMASRTIATGEPTEDLIVVSLDQTPPTSKRLAVADSVESLAIRPDGAWLAATGKQSWTLWDLTTPKPTTAQRLNERTTATAFSDDGNWLLTGAENRAILFRLGRDRIETFEFAVGGSPDRVFFSPDSLKLAVTTTIGTMDTGSSSVVLFELAGQKPTMHPLRGRYSYVWDGAWSQDGRYLAVGSRDGVVLRWDVAASDTGDSAVSIPGHRDHVTRVWFTPDDLLATFSRDGNLLVHGLDIEPLLERARKATGRGLSDAEKIQYGLQGGP